MTRKPRTPIDTSAVLALLPATRREIMARLGLTSISHDRALSRALQAMREAGQVYPVNVIGTEGYTWHAVTCEGYRFDNARRRLMSDICRCMDAKCLLRETCERWLQRSSGRVRQASFACDPGR
jgi:hypothetical protein